MTDYVFKAGRKDLAPLLLLHSTGGDEHQLVEIAEMIAPSHPILSIRGRINEQGVNRYFKLRGLGGFTKENFDLESLDEETDWLTDEVSLLAEKHDLDVHKMIAIGYSNGANVALNMFLRGKINFDKIIAFHGMQLEDFEQTVQLDDKHVFLSYAPNDMIVPQKYFGDLKGDLEDSGCQLEIYESSLGHQLTQEEVLAAKKWLTETK